jgi:hypothetical protein
MTPKEELKKMIEVIEKDIESPIYQCNPRIATLSRFATINNYEEFIKKEIGEEELRDNNNRIGAVSRKFDDICSCMKEAKKY